MRYREQQVMTYFSNVDGYHITEDVAFGCIGTGEQHLFTTAMRLLSSCGILRKTTVLKLTTHNTPAVCYVKGEHFLESFTEMCYTSENYYRNSESIALDIKNKKLCIPTLLTLMAKVDKVSPTYRELFVSALEEVIYD